MTARDDYPLSAQGAFSSVEGVKMLDEIDRLRTELDGLRLPAQLLDMIQRCADAAKRGRRDHPAAGVVRSWLDRSTQS